MKLGFKPRRAREVGGGGGDGGGVNRVGVRGGGGAGMLLKRSFSNYDVYSKKRNRAPGCIGRFSTEGSCIYVPSKRY